jgi:hypothetical protein
VASRGEEGGGRSGKVDGVREKGRVCRDVSGLGNQDGWEQEKLQVRSARCAALLWRRFCAAA